MGAYAPQKGISNRELKALPALVGLAAGLTGISNRELKVGLDVYAGGDGQEVRRHLK